MDEPNSAHSAACDGFNFLFDPTEKPTSKPMRWLPGLVAEAQASPRALWESLSPGLQGFLGGKPFNQGDCRVCGMGEGGLEDGSAGTNQELKTLADCLGDSGSFLW